MKKKLKTLLSLLTHNKLLLKDKVLLLTGYGSSPRLQDFTERIRINGVPINKQYVTSFVNQHQQLFETVRASFFEISVAIAFAFLPKKE